MMRLHSDWAYLEQEFGCSIRDRFLMAVRSLDNPKAVTPFLVGDAISLADISLLAYTRVAHEGGFHLDGYAAVRRWISATEKSIGLPPAR